MFREATFGKLEVIAFHSGSDRIGDHDFLEAFERDVALDASPSTARSRSSVSLRHARGTQIIVLSAGLRN